MGWFLAGLGLGLLIGWRQRVWQAEKFKGTMIAIFEGWAEPDENGNVGWGRPPYARKYEDDRFIT